MKLNIVSIKISFDYILTKNEIVLVNYQITHASTDDLSRMRNICFGRRGVR